MVLAFLAVAVACQEPTQVTIVITTRDRCENLSDVSTYVGPDPIETQARFTREVPTGVSSDCDPDGRIGTLVITPGGGSGTILVAVGVRGGDGTPAPLPTKCFEPEIAKRCIVARRTFSFIENKPLVLPIDLDPLCVGQSCDPASTCFKGACVSSTVVCVGTDCGLSQENPGGIPTGEGGATESGSSDAAYDAELDGGPFEDVADTSPPNDAMADGSPIVYPACMDLDGSATVRCDFTTGHGANAGGCADASTCCKCTCPSSMTVVGCSANSCDLLCQ